jgi:hypothetical protein
MIGQLFDVLTGYREIERATNRRFCETVCALFDSRDNRVNPELSNLLRPARELDRGGHRSHCVLIEHWDVIQDEVTQEQSKSGQPMFGSKFATYESAG